MSVDRFGGVAEVVGGEGSGQLDGGRPEPGVVRVGVVGAPVGEGGGVVEQVVGVAAVTVPAAARPAWRKRVPRTVSSSAVPVAVRAAVRRVVVAEGAQRLGDGDGGGGGEGGDAGGGGDGSVGGEPGEVRLVEFDQYAAVMR